MKAIIQRVSSASVNINGETVGQINAGCLILLGVEQQDDVEIADKLAKKISQFRFFSDAQGKMNVNILESGGSALVVSQFTLVADTKKGNRPGFSRGASPEQGRILYHAFMDKLAETGVNVQSGRFAADMQVSLVNDGPVTFCLEI